MRRQLASYGSNDRVRASVERMEREHVAAAQKWEYRREAMVQERRRPLSPTHLPPTPCPPSLYPAPLPVQERAAMLEDAMVAFHSIGRSGRTPGVFRSRLADAAADAGGSHR